MDLQLVCGVTQIYRGRKTTDVYLVLVVVAALWAKVDYSTKILMPWQELLRGPASAEKTVLLDYISPLSASSLWQAIKNRHWAVVVTLLGWFLLLLTTILSTGLLILEATKITNSGTPISVLSTFNADGFDLANVTSTPAEMFYGIRFQGLQYPVGTFNDRVVPILEAPAHSSSQVNYSAVVPGLEIGFECEVLPIQNATVAILPWFSILGSFWVTNITTPDCNITGAIVARSANHNIVHVENATQNFQGNLQDFQCNTDINYSEPSDDIPVEKWINGSSDHRILLTVADLRFSPTQNGMAPKFVYMEKLTAVLCKANYTMNQYSVTASSTSDITSDAEKIPDSLEDSSQLKLPIGQLGMAVRAAAVQMEIAQSDVDYVLSWEVPTFFQFLSLLNGNTSIGAFIDDTDLLIRQSSEVSCICMLSLLFNLVVQGTMHPTSTDLCCPLVGFQRHRNSNPPSILTEAR